MPARMLKVAVRLLILLVPVGLAAQAPSMPPAALPLEAAQFPPFVESTLANGLRLLVVYNTKQPVVSLTLAIPAGSYHDPAGKSGLAEMVAGLLTKGTGSRSADEIAAAIEGVGGSLNASAGSDVLTVSTAVLTGNKQLAFDLLADVVVRPTFPEKEVELLRTQTLSGLALEKSQPASIASRAFAKGLYGDHPYGRRADENSVRTITQGDIATFHGTYLKPAGALLVVAGMVEATEAKALAEAAFMGWAGAAPTALIARAAPQRARSEILLVHRPGSVQSNIVVGNTTWMPTDSRGYALTLANQVLGGASDSRLFTILRETKGWTYGSYSGVTRSKQLGSFSATAEVRTEVTDSSLVELLAQMRRMSSELVPADEFDRQKATLVGRFPLQVETAAQVAGQVANARLLGLPTDYVQTYRTRLAAVTREQLQAAVRAAIRADGALIVVVGDATKVGERLSAVAPVRMVDVEGKAIVKGDLEVRGGALDLDFSRLAARSDSFTVMLQGRAFGYQLSTVAKDGDGWVAKEESAIGPIIQQATEVRMGPDLAMRAVKQTGRFQGQEMKLDVTYAAGKASGEGITPGATGAMTPVKYADIDAPLGTLDDNAVQAILPLFKWTKDASFKIAIFASGKGTLEQRTLRVVSEESVTVPLGTFVTYRIEMSGGAAPGTFWVEAGAPYRVMKFGPAGVPLEVVRVR